MASGGWFKRPALLLALGLCGVGGVVTLLGHLSTGPQLEQKRIPLTSESGAQAYPAFSPDGSQVAYSARGAGADDVFHVFVRPAVPGVARQLTTEDASDIAPVWSPDGKSLAFARIGEGRAEAIVIPAAGGPERKIAEFDWAIGPSLDPALPPPLLAWTPDAKSLAVATGGGEGHPSAISLIDVAGGQIHPLTKPPQSAEGDSNPVIAPDGSLSFVRTLENERTDVYLSDLKGGAARQLTFDGRAIRGIAWTPGAHDLVYASERGQGWRLWRVPGYGGSPRDLLIGGRRILYPTVAATGNRLAYMESPALSEIWQATLGGAEDDSNARPLIRSEGRELRPAWSPDGKSIASVSEQNGEQQIWVSSQEGRVQVTRMEGSRMLQPQWSPDGRTLLFECHSQRGVEVYKTPATAAGKAVRVLTDAREPSWSRDGKSIYYTAHGGVWKADADGGNPRRINRNFGSGAPQESVDGKFVYFRSRRSLWRANADGSKEEEIFVPEHDILYDPIQVTAAGIYYTEYDRARRAVVLAFYEFDSGKSRPVYRIKGFDQGDGYSVSPDGARLLFARVDNTESHIVEVENFR